MSCTAPASFLVDGGLPRADCPQRAVCLPDLYHQRPGTCVAECQSDADCRTGEGYFCRKTFFVDGGAVLTPNGYCAPTHCVTRGCSTTFECFC